MGKSLARKILESHIVEGAWSPGTELGIRIDQTLTQDATGTMAYLQFETLGIARVRTELSVSYIDHNTMQVGFENADDHRYLQAIAKKYGLYLSRAGNGICHQVHLERFGKPGKTLLGSDSHTPTCGGIGMVAIGAGGLDVALAMGGSPFHVPCPSVTGLTLSGRLRPWVSAKDVALRMLGLFGTKGNVGTVFEYRGEGLAGLSVPERATIANMGAECGVTFSLFPSDGVTRDFMRSQGRESGCAELLSHADAEYDRELTIDLSTLEPLIAAPHSPGNVHAVREFEGESVQQVCIGSCTNSSFKDLATVAAMLKGKTVHEGTSLVVTPGSRQVVRNISEAGWLDALIDSGARFVEPCCGFCIGNGQSPASGSLSLRTSNRNFESRSGTADARVFLSSPETAAAAAITGRITDPRDLGMEYPVIARPAEFLADDSMIIAPADEATAAMVEIIRGPNIGSPPVCSPYPGSIRGTVAIKVGDRITTDHIMPAGARMKYRSNIEAYAAYVFENVDGDFSRRAVVARDMGLYNVIVAGQSYGQGSSREHAAICPAWLGVRAVVAKSFERIHAANLVNFGILPLVFERESDYDLFDRDDELEIADVREAVRKGSSVSIRLKAKGIDVGVRCSLGERERAILLSGGALGRN